MSSGNGNRWNRLIRIAEKHELQHYARLVGVTEKNIDFYGDLEDRIWEACQVLRAYTDFSTIAAQSGPGLDAFALAYEIERKPGEPDQSLLGTIKNAFDAHHNSGGNDWACGRHFCRKQNGKRQPVSPGSEAELYRVLHPGLAGGKCAFVLRIDTGEEMLFDRSSTSIRMIDDEQELKERLQESSFKALMQRYESGEINLGTAMHAARSILLPPGTKC